MPPSRPPIVAIASPVRGEASHLLEWIAYHRALGIRAFFLADNGGPDDTSKLLHQLHDAKIIFRFDWREHTQFQLRFYQQAFAAARLFAHGLFLIDVDEFLRPAEDYLVPEMAAPWLSDATIGAIALNWAVYGSSGRVERGEGLVIERFTRRGLQNILVNHHVKTLARVASCAGPGGNPHWVERRTGRYINTRGEDVVWDTKQAPQGVTTKVVWDVLRVDHFFTKSRVEYEAKRARGTFGPPRDWDQYFLWHDCNEVDDPMPPALVERTKVEMARILEQLRKAA